MRRKSMIAKKSKIFDTHRKSNMKHQKTFDNNNQSKGPKSPMTIGDDQIIEMHEESLYRTGSPRNPENCTNISEQRIYDLKVSDLRDSPKRAMCKICLEAGPPVIDTGQSLGPEEKYIFYAKNQTWLEGKLVKYLESTDEALGQFCEAESMDECEKIWKANEQYKVDFRSFTESLKDYFDAQHKGRAGWFKEQSLSQAKHMLKFADEQKNDLEYFIYAIEGFIKDAKWRIHSSDGECIPTPDLVVNSIANLNNPERVKTMPDYPTYRTKENLNNKQKPSDFLGPFADSKKSLQELLENPIKAHMEKHSDLQNSRLIENTKQSGYTRPNNLEK